MAKFMWLYLFRLGIAHFVTAVPPTYLISLKSGTLKKAVISRSRLKNDEDSFAYAAPFPARFNEVSGLELKLPIDTGFRINVMYSSNSVIECNSL